MAGKIERQAERRARRRASPLENAQHELAHAGFEREPQAGRRGLAHGAGRTKQEGEPAAGFGGHREAPQLDIAQARHPGEQRLARDRKSTRLNSSHPSISYAVFCLKKKKKQASM